jgi:hypothetical protein
MRRGLEGTLERKLAKMWPDRTVCEQVLSILGRYGTERWEREGTRVKLAILKLSGGDAEALPKLVEAAKTDYRDVLLWAEYPEQARTRPAPRDRSASGEARHKRMLDRDRRRYEEWLKK